MTHSLAGTRPDPASLTSSKVLEERYLHPEEPLKPLKNGTSGHRGRTGSGFSEHHVAAMSQALADIRRERGHFGPGEAISGAAGPVVLGKDVRYTSDFAQVTAAEVLAGNGYEVRVHRGGRSTPTPVISHAIRAANAGGARMEGGILTASHNPPEDAGFKSNGLDGGPNTRTTQIDAIANRHLTDPGKIRRMDWDEAVRSGRIVEIDLVGPYVDDLGSVVDMDAVRGQPFAATPLGGSAVGYYEAINARWGTDIHVALGEADPASARRTYDWDGKLRGDPSSPWVMKAVEGIRESLGVPFVGANDNDADRFGGEDSTGSLNPNHVLCVIVDQLCRSRDWDMAKRVGRTIGTTHMLDLIAAEHGRAVEEVNVGFKWYVAGVDRGEYLLAGEESAGLTIPRRDGSPWVTEKDGIMAVLLMMEIMGRTGLDIGTLYAELEARHGVHRYERVDAPATPDRKARLRALAAAPAQVEALLLGRRVAGRGVERVKVGDGVKVVLDGGVWVLKRPSGTEDIVKDYREERGGSLDTARQASAELDSLLGL